MKFMDQGLSIEIKGDHSLSKTLVTPQSLMKVTEVEAVSILWEVQIEDDTKKMRLGVSYLNRERGNCIN